MKKIWALVALIALTTSSAAMIPPGYSADPPYPPETIKLAQGDFTCQRVWIQTDSSKDSGSVDVSFSIPDAIKESTSITLSKEDSTTNVPLSGGTYVTKRDNTNMVSAGAFIFRITAPKDAKVGDIYRIGVVSKNTQSQQQSGQLTVEPSIGEPGFLIEIVEAGKGTPRLDYCKPLPSDVAPAVQTAAVVPTSGDSSSFGFIVAACAAVAIVAVVLKKQKKKGVKKKMEEMHKALAEPIKAPSLPAQAPISTVRQAFGEQYKVEKTLPQEIQENIANLNKFYGQTP